MPDCFISHSSKDTKIAEYVDKVLKCYGITAFMASDSLRAGQNWQQEIMENLKNSKWVIFLASRAASLSPFVNQEIGGALNDSKNLIPIVWDMPPSELPGWAKSVQAIDLNGKQTMDALPKEIASIAQRIKQDKDKGLLIIGAIFAAILFFSRE